MHAVPLTPRAAPAEPPRVSVPGALTLAFVLMPVTLVWTPVICMGLIFALMALLAGGGTDFLLLGLVGVSGVAGLVALWSTLLPRAAGRRATPLRGWQWVAFALGTVAAVTALVSGSLENSYRPQFGWALRATLVAALVLLAAELSLRWVARRGADEPEPRSVR